MRTTQRDSLAIGMLEAVYREKKRHPDAPVSPTFVPFRDEELASCAAAFSYKGSDKEIIQREFTKLGAVCNMIDASHIVLIYEGQYRMVEEEKADEILNDPSESSECYPEGYFPQALVATIGEFGTGLLESYLIPLVGDQKGKMLASENTRDALFAHVFDGFDKAILEGAESVIYSDKDL